MRAEPAEVFAALLPPLPRSVLDAAVPALDEVFFRGDLVCDSADPAADFADLLADLLLRTFDAAVAARLLVTSRLAIFVLLRAHWRMRPKLHGRYVV